MVYTKAEIDAALVAPVRVWTFRFERIGLTSDVVLGSEEVESCTIANNDLATEVKRTCKVSLSPDSTFDYLQHSLRPFAQLRMPDGGFQEWCLGTFYLSTPQTQPDKPRQPIETEGFDWGLKASQTRSASRVTTTDLVASTYGDAIIALLALAGFPPTATTRLLSVSTALPTVLEWEPGTSILAMINSLLAGLNFQSFSVDVFGEALCNPYSDPLTDTPTWAYTRDSSSVTINQSTVITLDTFDTPNQWVGSYSVPDLNPMLVVKINDLPSSPYSTVSRGRTITRILSAEEVGTPPDVAALTATVDRFAAEASQQVEEVTFTSGLMPFHGSGDVLDVDAGAGVKRYREHSWDMDLRAGGLMKHVVRRTVTL